MIRPIGLAVSIIFNTTCAAFHAFVAIVTTFCAAATASVATLFLIVAAVDAINALVLAYSVVVRVLIPAISVETAANAWLACAAIVTNGRAPFTSPPICSFISPSVLTNCCCLPLSVAANSAFISPTLFCITWASIAARSCSVPYLITLASASVNDMPTRFSASTWPIIALPIKLPTCTASPVLAFSPFCCANKLFIAGISVSKLAFSFRNVAICCAPDNCTSSPITPISCCALASSLMLCISASVAPIRCCITVANLVSATSCTAYASAKSFIPLCSWLKLRCAASMPVAKAAKFITLPFSCCASDSVDVITCFSPSASLAKSLKLLLSPSSLKVMLIVLLPAISLLL